MSVYIPIPIAVIEYAREPTSRTYKLDFYRGRIFSAGSADGIEAIKQYVKKALLTPRFRCLIYDNQYGSEIKQTIIAGDATPEFIETELERLIVDALTVDSRILSVRDVEYEIDGNEVHISFIVESIFGETTIDEVI